MRHRPDAVLSARYDRVVARRLCAGANVFVGWSSQCLASLRMARAHGMITVVERGSAHILWQRDTLVGEEERTGIRSHPPGSATIDRELEEYATADYIAVPSGFVARTFVERGIHPARLLVNPFGVDLSRFDGIRGERRAGGLRVLHVGSVSLRKGVHYLVPAVASVPDARLELVGALEPGIERVVAQPHVDVVGPVPGAELPRRYRDADVFCLLSLEEGLALVVAQAMAMALPVVVTENTGAAELVTDGVEGFIIPARDTAMAADRLRLLAADPALRCTMGTRARERVTAGFSWNDYGDRARAVYRRIVAAHMQ